MSTEIVRELVNGEWVTRVGTGGGGGGGGTVDSVTAADATITVTGTAADPEIAVTPNTYQPLDSDLTAIAALTTTAFGRGLLELAAAANLRTAAGYTAATVPFTPDGGISATDVQAAIVEAAGGGGGGANLYDPLGFGIALNTLTVTPGVVGAWDTANRAYFWRCHNGKEGATAIKLNVGTQSGNLSFAIYRTSGSGVAQVPGTVVVATGAVACPAAGYRSIALGASYDILPGDWIGMTVDNNSAQFSRMFNGIDTADVWRGMGGYKESAHPLSGSTPGLDGYGFPGACYLTAA